MFTDFDDIDVKAGSSGVNNKGIGLLGNQPGQPGQTGQTGQGRIGDGQSQNANVRIPPHVEDNDAGPGDDSSSDILMTGDETEVGVHNPVINETTDLRFSDINLALENVDSRAWNRERARELSTSVLIQEITSAVIDCLSRSFQSQSGIRTRPSNDQDQGQSSGSSSGDQNTNDSANHGKGPQSSKRKNRGDEEEAGDDSRDSRERGGPGPSKKPNLQADPDRQFACPFLKMNPSVYRSWKCCLFSWPTVARLKYMKNASCLSVTRY
jgi:hypothetical protein